MKSLVMLAVLWMGPANHYKSASAFIKAHRIDLKEMCEAYCATNCVVKKISGNSIEGTGFAIEDNSAQWVLYGRKDK